MGTVSFVVVLSKPLTHHGGNVDIVRTVVQRIFLIALVVAITTFFLSCLIRLMPGDLATIMVPNALPETVASIRETAHLDLNVFQYWFKWLGNLVTGDLGYYFAQSGNTPVLDVIKRTLPTSAILVLYVQIVALVISVPLGLLSAYKEGTRLDRILQSVLFTLSSIPNFIIAVVLVLFFSIKWTLLPPIDYVKPGDDLVQHFRHLALPVITLSVALIASYTRLLRADVIATLKEDYVMMAMSKGISNSRVLWKHVLRPSSTTLLTSAALNMGALIGGTIVIETIFNLPGLGYEIAAAIVQRQVVALQTLIAIVSFIYVFFNSIVDIVANIIDPRTRERRV